MRDDERTRSGSTWIWLAAAALGLALSLACAPTAPVIQGPVVSIDANAKTLTLQDEDRPGDPPVTLDISRAEIGDAPQVGEVVRIAYRIGAGGNVALRVMNLTQQKERDKKGT